ncbi:MAG: response regulator [Chrysiogenetes bacterium]|nr:response regulator [Chrysiogenetes bacterium]
MNAIRKVVVCEDDAVTQRYLQKVIALIPDTEVHLFSSVGTALLAVESMKPALVIMDHRLPGATGSDAVGRLRKTEWGKSVPVLVYTGADVREEALANGASDFISKPASAPQLIDKISALLAN